MSIRCLFWFRNRECEVSFLTSCICSTLAMFVSWVLFIFSGQVIFAIKEQSGSKMAKAYAYVFSCVVHIKCVPSCWTACDLTFPYPRCCENIVFLLVLKEHCGFIVIHSNPSMCCYVLSIKCFCWFRNRVCEVWLATSGTFQVLWCLFRQFRWYFHIKWSSRSVNSGVVQRCGGVRIGFSDVSSKCMCSCCAICVVQIPCPRCRKKKYFWIGLN